MNIPHIFVSVVFFMRGYLTSVTTGDTVLVLVESFVMEGELLFSGGGGGGTKSISDACVLDFFNAVSEGDCLSVIVAGELFSTIAVAVAALSLFSKRFWLYIRLRLEGFIFTGFAFLAVFIVMFSRIFVVIIDVYESGGILLLEA